MPQDSFQQFVDQHPALFAAIFPFYFIGLWLLVSTLTSLLGGWFSLAKLYRTRIPFKAVKFRLWTCQMRWRTHYSNVITTGANQEGLYLASMFLFRFMHPPLFVPWTEVKVQRTKGWLFEYVTFTLGRELAIPMRIRRKPAERLRTMAGDGWPVEDT
jgi:hypothetical protein